jgi:hypothetical protein
VTAETHFVQAGGGPVLTGSGAATLSCPCGNTLIEGYDAHRFLAIGIQCARCGSVTATQPLAEGKLPPRSAIIAAPSAEPRMTAMTVPPDITVVGQAEMVRLQALFEPVTPADSAYTLSPALLDEVVAAFERYTGDTLPDVATNPNEPFAGLREHALAWAIYHLRRVMRTGARAYMADAPAANAATHVTGFLYFVATWSRHPLFPAMVTSAAGRGFSLHGLAPFAAAHCLAMMGNRIRMPEPMGYPGRIDGFSLVTGSDETVAVHIEIFDRFEFPFGQPRDPAKLFTAVSDVIGRAQARINLRNPGLLVLSPGTAVAGYDEALIEAVKASMQSSGRKNNGLMAVAPVVLRLQALPDPHAIRLVYGFFPILNRHYRGAGLVRTAG